MNTPNPNPNPATPSNSVVVGVAIGGPVAILVSWALDQFFKVQMPPEASAALGTLVTAAAAYFGNGGKAIHTA